MVKTVLTLVIFAFAYPIQMVFTTVRRVLNFVLTIIARALFLDRIVNKLAAWLVRRSDLFFSRHGDPLLRGDLLAYAEDEYPRDRFPTAWEDIPDDVRHELVWDGRLLNGRRVAELAKAKITDEVVGQALVRSGIHALALTFIIAGLPMYLYAIDSGQGIMGLFAGRTPFPSWAWDNGAIVPVLAWGLLTFLERILFVMQLSITTGLLFLAFPLFWFFAFAAAMNSAWETASASYRVATRDSEVFWKSNILTRQNQYKAYCREVENACHRLKDQPIIPVGEATGLIRGRGDMEAPDRGTIVCYDGESIRQHTLILGGTGSGKTRLVIRPLFERLMNAAWGEGHRIGAYITDGKGTLWKTLAPVVAHRKKDIAILGTAEGQSGLDLCQGMTPLEISTTFKAVAGQINGEREDSFWPESASLLLMHSAAVARALHVHKPTLEEWKLRRGHAPYSLIGIARLASEEPSMKGAFELIGEFIDAEPDGYFSPEEQAILLSARESKEWLENSHFKLGDITKGSIIANVSSVLGKLSGAPDVSMRFCSGAFDPEMTVDVDHALKGGILFVAIGETEHGMAGKVVNCWLKTRLYILAKRRLQTNPEGCRNTSCALVADEFQMLATVGPDTDTTFWNIARETGVFMVAATQSVAALNQAIGKDATSNLMNLLRSKIVLKTEETETLQYVKQLAGEVARGWEYEPKFYATQAIRQLEIGNGGQPTISVGGFQGLFPTHFEALTYQEEPYSAAHIGAVWEAASNPVGNGTVDTGDGGASQNLQQMMMREEDQNRQSFIGSLQMRPKIDTDELLVGSGMAFAIIQRAGGDRMDIIDLDIAA
ncbi:type IV secretory system conjugative DNA transfer family protein [Ensifer sp. B1-9]|uniref:type IV secretory system conjugative DNA transfer family protein n=1 Tax=Ensifer sp. B1-9 TaxID=3141455 RepID=UPI003D1E4894